MKGMFKCGGSGGNRSYRSGRDTNNKNHPKESRRGQRSRVGSVIDQASAKDEPQVD